MCFTTREKEKEKREFYVAKHMTLLWLVRKGSLEENRYELLNESHIVCPMDMVYREIERVLREKKRNYVEKLLSFVGEKDNRMEKERMKEFLEFFTIEIIRALDELSNKGFLLLSMIVNRYTILIINVYPILTRSFFNTYGHKSSYLFLVNRSIFAHSRFVGDL